MKLKRTFILILALLACAAFTGMGDTGAKADGTVIMVSSWDALCSALGDPDNANNTVQLQADVTWGTDCQTEGITVPSGRTVTLDLAWHTMAIIILIADADHTRYTDHVEIKAGWKTLFV